MGHGDMGIPLPERARGSHNAPSTPSNGMDDADTVPLAGELQRVNSVEGAVLRHAREPDVG